MKITLEFDDMDEARDAMDGVRWRTAMWELDQELRSSVKYDDSLSGEVTEAYDKLREKIREILMDSNLKL